MTLDHRQVMVIPKPPSLAERAALGLEVQHTRTGPVLLIGHGSSGTSISAGLIRKYLNVAFGTESQFFIRYLRLAPRYGDLSNERHLDRLIGDILGERFFMRTGRQYGFRPTVANIKARMADRTYPALLRVIFDLLAEHLHASRWGEKTPEYVHHLRLLDVLFPDAQYIYCVRDGRDVALSVFDRYFGAKNIIHAALEWRHAGERIEAFLATLAPDRYLQVRYEDLLTQPRQWFASLIHFLEISDPEGRLLDRIEQEVRAEFKPGTLGKWKTGLPVRQREIFEALTGDYLTRYGYEREFSAPQPPATWAMAWSPWDNKLRKWGSTAYWFDHVYRVRLRLKDWWIKLREAIL